MAVLAAACGDDDADDPAQVESTEAAAATPADEAAKTELEGANWALVPGDQLGVPSEGVAVTASFEDGMLAGFGGCNQYSTEYVLDGTSLTIGTDIASTTMACPDAESAVEAAYLERLPLVVSYTVTGGTLTLLDSAGSTLLEYEAVVGADAVIGSWNVTSYYSGDAITSVLAGADLTIEFDAEQVSGSTGCNTFTGPYTVDGESISIGPLTTTRASCAGEDLQQQEADFLSALELAASYSVTGPRLDLLRPGGTIAVTSERA